MKTSVVVNTADVEDIEINLINMPKSTIRIANISGFYGDRLSAAHEMITGGEVDFLTGDYLAELTMAILYKSKLKRPTGGYARTFLKQMQQVMQLCMERGVKVVTNAGGLNPKALAEALQKVADELNLSPKIAYIEGDDLMPRLSKLQKEGVVFKHLDRELTLKDSKMLPVSANAYLGCWGIVEALQQGADIVVTGRVADTSVVMAPAAYHFGWQRNDWDQLAGAAVAGHIIECGGQATGGNYSLHNEVPTYKNLGFPIAEMQADGSCVITKHENTGGIVNIGTVTAQLMYEINAPAYVTPDVVAHFETIKLSLESPNRVRVENVQGSPATSTAKVTVNCHAGFQNDMIFYIAGLDIERKVELLQEIILDAIGGESAFDKIEFQYLPTHKDNPNSNEEAFAQLRVFVQDRDMAKAGKFFTSKVVETALCSVAGVAWQHGPQPPKPRIVHFPTLIEKRHLRQSIFIDNQLVTTQEVVSDEPCKAIEIAEVGADISFTNAEMVEAYLGEICAARSGDKGGNANLGVWGKTPAAYAYLKQLLTVDYLKELLPDAANCKIIRYDFPNLLGLNFYLIGFLGDGVAATTKMDGQAKALGEYLRAKRVVIPKKLLTN
ncbi:MAG: acyclic terpene utilization AtuA family protein [Saprospiraceae bacterium]